MECRCR